MKTYQSEPDASARDAAATGLSLADASGYYDGKFLFAARLRANLRSAFHAEAS